MTHTILPIASLLLLAAGSLRAQEIITLSDPMNVAITARGGIAVAAARGDFPSLIIGDSRRGTGALGQQSASAEAGAQIEVAALIPVRPALGVSLSFGSQLLTVTWPADSMREATRFERQSLQAGAGVQWSLLDDPASYAHGGLRSVYVDGGIDVGLGTLGNRVESTAYDDTLGTVRRAADGSFASGEPFRTVVALRGGVGLRFAPTPNMEIVLEASYAHALNPVFSSDAIEGNDFKLDVTRAVLGVGYRF